MQSSNDTTSRAEKREVKNGRRKFRREIMHRMRRIATKRLGLVATNAQIEAAARILTDRYMHMVDHPKATIAPVPETIPPRAHEVAECPAS